MCRNRWMKPLSLRQIAIHQHRLPYASLDSGLIFERDTRLFGNDYTQTLEPRLFYYYSNPGDQDDMYNFDSNALSMSYAQLFRDYRLAGEDYIDDNNQLSLGVSSRLLSPVTGRELLRVGIGQAFYFDERDVVVEEDPVRAEAPVRPYTLCTGIRCSGAFDARVGCAH